MLPITDKHCRAHMSPGWGGGGGGVGMHQLNKCCIETMQGTLSQAQSHLSRLHCMLSAEITARIVEIPSHPPPPPSPLGAPGSSIMLQPNKDKRQRDTSAPFQSVLMCIL